MFANKTISVRILRVFSFEQGLFVSSDINKPSNICL